MRSHSWEAVNNGLADLEVRSLAIDSKGYVFVGTEGGRVFYSFDSIDAGVSWTEHTQGKTNRPISSMAAVRQGDSVNLYVGTLGRGIWHSTLDLR